MKSWFAQRMQPGAVDQRTTNSRRLFAHLAVSVLIVCGLLAALIVVPTNSTKLYYLHPSTGSVYDESGSDGLGNTIASGSFVMLISAGLLAAGILAVLALLVMSILALIDWTSTAEGRRLRWMIGLFLIGILLIAFGSVLALIVVLVNGKV